MITTAIPGVLDALLAACRAEADGLLAGRTILDGPMRRGQSAHELLLVGGEWLPSTPGRQAITASQTFSPMGNNSRDEQLLISCAAVSQLGDEELAPRRAAAFATFAAVEAILAADPGVGGDHEALIRSVDSVQQIQNDRGAACAVNFTVSASALLWNG